MFKNLMEEVNAIQQAWGYGTIEALEFILNHEEEYTGQVRRELKEFMRQGAMLFAPRNA